MKRLDRCCFCTSVQHGALILAVLTLLRYSAMFIGSASALANKSAYIESYNNAAGEKEKEIENLPEGDEKRLIGEALVAVYQSVAKAIPGILTSVLLENLAGLAMSGCLLYGLRSKRHIFILPYLIVHLLDFIFLAIITLVLLYFVFAGAGAGYGILCLIFGTGLNFLNFYFWWVIQSEYRNIKDRAENGGYMRESNIVLKA